MAKLSVAEIPFPNGDVRFRYGRILSRDGAQWIRHGLYSAYHQNGVLASEGHYVHGKEQGLWRDYHTNGWPAAEGSYDAGNEVGEWKFWNADGSPSRYRPDPD